MRKFLVLFISICIVGCATNNSIPSSRDKIDDQDLKLILVSLELIQKCRTDNGYDEFHVRDTNIGSGVPIYISFMKKRGEYLWVPAKKVLLEATKMNDSHQKEFAVYMETDDSKISIYWNTIERYEFDPDRKTVEFHGFMN